MADWMGSLPESVRKKPLCTLCIPGSHDSGAYWFNLQLDYAHDQSFLRYYRNFKCDFAKRIVKRWGITQSLPIDEQLKIGIRFFDLRLEIAMDANSLSHREEAADVEDESEKCCFIVHGLYSTDWLILANQIVKFLAAHPEEVVILNVNHIYRMRDDQFRLFFLHPLDSIAKRHGLQLCSTDVDLRTISLEELLKKNFRIIVVGPLDVDIEECCFRSGFIQNRWPNKNNIGDVINFLQAQIDSPVTSGLRVMQGVITPKLFDIFRHFRSSLRKIYSLPMRSVLKEWLRRLDKEEIGNMNILISDQVDVEFCRLVYYLNVSNCPEHKLDGYSENPYLDGKHLEARPWSSDGTYPTPPESGKNEKSSIIDTMNEVEPDILIEEIFEGVDASSSSLAPKKPTRASVMIQQVEMVLETDSSSEDTSAVPRSPIPPPKPKRFSQRIPIVMEVEPIPDDAIPTIYPVATSVPFSRSSDNPVRIALPVTEEELRLAALGEYVPYGSQRSPRTLEVKKESVEVEEQEDEECEDEHAPLIPHEVESMVEDLVINSTIDAMDCLAKKFKRNSD